MAKKLRRSNSGAVGLNRAGQWWLAAGALVLGLVLGAITAGLLSEGSPSLSQQQANSESSAADDNGSTAVVSSTPASGATAEVIVNDACLRAVNAAQNALSAFQDIGEAARSFNAAELDSIIRRLQPLQATLLEDVDACKVTTKLPNGVTVASSLPGSNTSTASTVENTGSTPKTTTGSTTG